MQRHLALNISTSLAAVLCLTGLLNGCSRNDPTLTSAPPVARNANPATVLPPGKKRYLGQTGISAAAPNGTARTSQR